MALTTVPVSLSATALTLTTAAQPNITSVGTLTGLTVSGNIAGTLTTAAQPNITSVGTLSSLLTAAAKIKLTDTGNATVAALQITDAGLGISSPTTDQMNFITADATRAVIDANGKVGIGSGATSPASLLHIDGAHSGGPIVTIHQTAGSSSADSGLDVETSSTGTIIQRWLNSGTPVMHVRGNGNVGIGPNTPAAKLHVQGTAMAERSRLSTNSGTTYWDLRRDSSSGHLVISDDGLGDVITVRQDTGTVGIGTTPSYKLHVSTSANIPAVLDSSATETYLYIRNSNAATGRKTYLAFAPANNIHGAAIYAEAMEDFSTSANRTADLVFETRNNGTIAQRMYIKADGKVGIGESNPSATLDIVGGGTNTNPTLELNSSTSNGFNHAINAFNSNLTAGENHTFFVGKEGSTKNSGYIGYKWNGAASNTNLLTFGHWANDNIMNLTADGKLGLGTQTPLGLLTIRGTGDAIRVESTNTGVGGAQLDLLHHTTSPADNDVPAAINFGGYYSGTNPAYSAAVRSEWKDVSAREGRLKFYTRNAGNFNTNMQIDYNGVVGVPTLSDMNNTGAIKMHRYNIGHIANYTGNLHLVTHAGIDHYEFTIQGNNTYQDLFNNIYSMGFELYIQLGDAASRDHALYSVNATSPAYGVSTFTQVYYNNGGWNTGSFTLQMIGTPGDNTEYTIQAKFTSYYSSSNTATGYVQIRRLY